MKNKSDKTKKDSANNEESSSLSNDNNKSLSIEAPEEFEKIMLTRKIDIIARYLANPNNEAIFSTNSFATTVINEFKAIYPNRDDHAEGLKKLCGRYYSL